MAFSRSNVGINVLFCVLFTVAEGSEVKGCKEGTAVSMLGLSVLGLTVSVTGLCVGIMSGLVVSVLGRCVGT